VSLRVHLTTVSLNITWIVHDEGGDPPRGWWGSGMSYFIFSLRNFGQNGHYIIHQFQFGHLESWSATKMQRDDCFGGMPTQKLQPACMPTPTRPYPCMRDYVETYKVQWITKVFLKDMSLKGNFEHNIKSLLWEFTLKHAQLKTHECQNAKNKRKPKSVWNMCTLLLCWHFWFRFLGFVLCTQRCKYDTTHKDFRLYLQITGLTGKNVRGYNPYTLEIRYKNTELHVTMFEKILPWPTTKCQRHMGNCWRQITFTSPKDKKQLTSVKT